MESCEILVEEICKKEGMDMIKVSVILPVYNEEQYIRQCLDSILTQTLKDIEIICIDDGFLIEIQSFFIYTFQNCFVI